MSWREEDDRMFFFVGFTRYDSYQLKIIVPQYRGDWNNLNNDCMVTRLLKKLQIQSD